MTSRVVRSFVLGLPLFGLCGGCGDGASSDTPMERSSHELFGWRGDKRVDKHRPRRPVRPVPSQRVFVSSRAVSSDLGGLRGADRFCHESAERAGLEGRWVALLSHSLIDARDRFALRTRLVNTHPRRPRVVARDEDDLFDGRSNRARIVWDEHGRRVPTGSPVWTASRPDGTGAGSSPRLFANDWSSPHGAVIGRVGLGKGRWLSAGFGSGTARLYCIERRRPLEARVSPKRRVTRSGTLLRARIEVAETARRADGSPAARTPIQYSFVIQSGAPPDNPRDTQIDFGNTRGPTGTRVLSGTVVATRPGVYPVAVVFDGLDSSGAPMGDSFTVGLNGNGPPGIFDDFQIPPPVIDTRFTCVVAGRESVDDVFPAGRSINTSDVNIAGTDLGFQMRHGGESYLLFGDTWDDQVPNEQTQGPGYDNVGDDAFGSYVATAPKGNPTLCGSNSSAGIDWARQDSDDFQPATFTIENGAMFFLGPFGTPLGAFSVDDVGFGIFPARPNDGTAPRIARFDGDHTFQLVTTPTGQANESNEHPLFFPTASATGQAEDWSWTDIDEQTGTGAAFVWGRTGNPFLTLSRPYLAGYPAEYLTALDVDAEANETTYYFTNGSSWSTDSADAVTIYNDNLDPHRVSHYSVAWVSVLDRWVMLYGGHLYMSEADFVLEDQGDVETGVYARQAPTPWGPWSKPQRVWHPLDQENGVDGYCTLLWHPERANNDPQCVQADVGRDAQGAATRQQAIQNSTYAPLFGDFGQEYGVSIVKDLVLDVSNGPAKRARIFWVMSTWNPYRVVLMETDLPIF